MHCLCVKCIHGANVREYTIIYKYSLWFFWVSTTEPIFNSSPCYRFQQRQQSRCVMMGHRDKGQGVTGGSRPLYLLTFLERTDAALLGTVLQVYVLIHSKKRGGFTTRERSHTTGNSEHGLYVYTACVSLSCNCIYLLSFSLIRETWCDLWERNERCVVHHQLSLYLSSSTVSPLLYDWLSARWQFANGVSGLQLALCHTRSRSPFCWRGPLNCLKYQSH